MFDTKQPFKLTIVSGTEKTCEVRFPTDKEWCARSRKQRVIIRDIGRGKTHRDVPKRELIDLELFQAIAGKEIAEAFDEYEAARIIERLGRAEAVSLGVG